MHDKVTISHLQHMKRERQKSVGLVAWDYQIARIADRAGFDSLSAVGFLVPQGRP
jgi:3-methyl-2-oxobutanoate hydroxymethyltransferase